MSEGDGKCSECHGDGLGDVMNQFADAVNPFTDEQTPCRNCNGTGECPTCSGTGVIDD